MDSVTAESTTVEIFNRYSIFHLAMQFSLTKVKEHKSQFFEPINWSAYKLNNKKR